MRRGRVDWRGSWWEAWCSDLRKLQTRVLERHVCPPRHEQRPLHSRHLLRSPHGGFLLLECDGVYQHNFISHSNMYAHCHTQMERGLGTVKSHWQSLTTGTSSRGECRDFIWARTTWPICFFEHRVCVIIMIMLWSWQGTFLFLSFSLFHVSLLLSCAHLDFLENAHRTLCLPCAAHIKCHMQSQPGYGCATQWCLWAKTGQQKLRFHWEYCVMRCNAGVFLAKY